MNKYKEGLSEKSVASIWQQQAMSNFVADTGQRVQILFPGRPCSDGGCDFQDAVVDIDGKAKMGNIEVHVLSSQWYSHGHHRDKKYNGIALHVVMQHDTSSAIVLQNGNTIPTICMNYVTFPLNKLNPKFKLLYQYTAPCLRSKILFKGGFLIDALISAGKERFFDKVASFQKNLISEDAGQVLFRNIARALGYSKNTHPFEKLADSLTLRTLEGFGKDNSITKQALILGTAGLLPSQRLRQNYKITRESEMATLETIWRSSILLPIKTSD